MHANLNKTASKTLLLLLPKDALAKKEKRENHEHFCIIYWKFVAHRQWQQWGMVWDELGGWPRSTQSGKTAWNVFLFCRAQCTLQLPPLPPCGLPACLPKALSFGLCAFIFHLHEFFIVFPDAKRKRSELHFTLRRISTNTRYLSLGNQLENQLATQTIAVPLYPSPKAPLSACSVILSHIDIHNVTVPSSAMYPKSVCFG